MAPWVSPDYGQSVSICIVGWVVAPHTCAIFSASGIAALTSGVKSLSALMMDPSDIFAPLVSLAPIAGLCIRSQSGCEVTVGRWCSKQLHLRFKVLRV